MNRLGAFFAREPHSIGVGHFIKQDASIEEIANMDIGTYVES